MYIYYNTHSPSYLLDYEKETKFQESVFHIWSDQALLFADVRPQFSSRKRNNKAVRIDHMLKKVSRDYEC